MKLLVTGFEPFDGELINPSEEIIKSIDVPNSISLRNIQLPVEFGAARKKLEEMIHQWEPDVVISIGQAGGRTNITLERVAINIDDARIPDNSGYQPKDIQICEDGPAAYFSTLPLRGIIDYLSNKNYDIRISNSAGTYVCNHVMYSALHLAATKFPKMKAGFIHVPYMKEQTVGKADTPSMDLQEMITCINIIISYFTESRKS